MRQAVISLFLAFSLMLVPAAFGAGKITVKGKVAAPGYRLFLGGASGNGFSAAGNFKVKTNLTSAALSLIDASGSAAGPVVIAYKSKGKVLTYKEALAKKVCRKSGTRAITGLKLQRVNGKNLISLATIKIEAGKGFGYLSGKTGKEYLLAATSSRVDSSCAPIGAGKLGIAAPLMKVKRSSSVHALGAIDSDEDGVLDSKDPDDDNDGAADSFDIDADGDGMLNFYEEERDDEDGKEKEEDFQSFLFSNRHVSFENAVNLHIGSYTREQLEEAFKAQEVLVMGVPGEGEFPVELDCAGLSYCSKGGTGRAQVGPGGEEGQAFPDSFDEDGDGNGRFDQIARQSQPPDFFLRPTAAFSDIAPGNVLTQVFSVKGSEVRRPLMLEFLFITTPALKSIALGQGVQETEVTYPIKLGDPGTNENCFQLPANQGQKVRITAYRPQRPGITAGGEPEYLDMGNLRTVIFYQVWSEQPSPNGHGVCPVSAFSELDANLEPYDDEPLVDGAEVGLLDKKGDVPFDVNTPNTFSFTLDLQKCTGVTTGTVQLALKLRTPRNDNSFQSFCIARP